MTTKSDVLATLRECRKKTEFLSCGVHYRIDAAIRWVEGQPDDATPAKPATRDFRCETCGVTYGIDARLKDEWLFQWIKSTTVLRHKWPCVTCGKQTDKKCSWCDAPHCCDGPSTARVLTFGPNEGEVLRD